MTPPTKEPPLTDSEILRLRAVLNQDAFVRQFWASIRSWVLAIAAIVAALTVGVEALGKAMNWIRGK
jgi:hypothetical protein